MITKKILGLLALVSFTLALASCGKDEPGRDPYANTEWRGKHNTDRMLDKRKVYTVVKFFGDKRYRVSAADSGGFIYKHLDTGTYSVKGSDIRLVSDFGGEEYLTYFSDTQTLQFLYYGVNLHLQ